jgi:5-methylcytosine-specific restriction protein B
LVKCAIAGCDPNVGRIVGAIGSFLGNIENGDALTKGLSVTLVDHICTSVLKVNAKIKDDPNLGEGFQIGHSYFCSFGSDQDENKWWNEILSFELKPLLEEIWFDDSGKVAEFLRQLAR